MALVNCTMRRVTYTSWTLLTFLIRHGWLFAYSILDYAGSDDRKGW
jgi:hypothetical protein